MRSQRLSKLQQLWMICGKKMFKDLFKTPAKHPQTTHFFLSFEISAATHHCHREQMDRMMGIEEEIWHIINNLLHFLPHSLSFFLECKNLLLVVVVENMIRHYFVILVIVFLEESFRHC